jgi:hypothetical protein
MKLELYIRSKTNQYLRDLIIKDKCEICNKDSDLELHHIKAFAVIMNECFDTLGYDRHDDTEKYTDIELLNITNWMLGAQLQSTYSTLCQKCHTDWHSEQGGFYKTTSKHEEYYKRKEIENKLKEIERCQNVIKPYLESVVGKKLYREEQMELIDIIDFRVDSKQQRSYSKLNYALREVLGLPYIIAPKRTNSARYWIVEKR